jgi:hypothetical protein
VIDKRKLIRHAVYNSITGCLNSLYFRNRGGYPQINLEGKTRRIHRVLLELKLGRKLNDDEFAIHKCNNRQCISTAIEHVVKGDRSENVRDAIERGSHIGFSLTRKPWKL